MKLLQTIVDNVTLALCSQKYSEGICQNVTFAFDTGKIAHVFFYHTPIIQLTLRLIRNVNIFQTNLPVFRVKESSVRRRYSDFEWLRNELERDSKIVVPPLPSKAIKRQLPFRSDDGIYEEQFIEDRRSGLEGFVNK